MIWKNRACSFQRKYKTRCRYYNDRSYTFPKLDNQYPATLSKEIITGLLREKLSYEGIIISDDMTMGAIIKNYTIEEAAIKFLKAGGDLLLICHGYENHVKIINRNKRRS